MPTAVKDLTAVDSTLVLDVSSTMLGNGDGSLGSCQYISGAGTVQVEATLQETDPAIWFIPTDPNLVAVAAQVAVGPAVPILIPGYNRIRVRKTVGGASCVVGLGFS